MLAHPHTCTSTHIHIHTHTHTQSCVKGTIGTVAVGDIDGDGWAEVVVPSYAENIVELFTFAPPPLEVPRASKGMWS